MSLGRGRDRIEIMEHQMIMHLEPPVKMCIWSGLPSYKIGQIGNNLFYNVVAHRTSGIKYGKAWPSRVNG